MRLLTAIILGGAILCVATPAPAVLPSPDTQIARYEVYAGGVNVLQALVTFEITKNSRYSVTMDATLKGFLAALVPWKGTFDSAGWILKNGDFRPQTHHSAATWRGDTELKEYRYAKDTGFSELIVTENGKTKKEKSDPELTRGTTDTLTAALAVLQDVANGKPCTGEAEVYDGRRRFRQIMRDKGVEDLKASSYNRFQGKATVCEAEVIPAGGEWHKKPRGWMSIQEQGRAAGALPTLWVAKLNKNGPAVPVKIRIKTAYGTLFLHLAEYKNNAKMARELSPEKSKDDGRKKQ